MERELFVYLDVPGAPVLVGQLWARARGERQSASFAYSQAWLGLRSSFSIDPELPLGPGQFHTERPLFNAFADPAPDRWGQNLLRRFERARARKESRQPRTLLAVDFLTCVDDETRLGALRFKDGEAGPFLASGDRRAPPLIDLPRLLSATARILEERETDEDLRLVLAPGTSLGGARPKASVRDREGVLAVAKFPRKDDDWPVTRWEATTLALAQAAGVDVPQWWLKEIAGKPVLLVRRFDREGLVRLPFMSAMTAVAAADHDARSYLDLVEALRLGGSQVDADTRQLWRRLVFNILVSNTDDHLRNHGFLRDPKGWRLAPAYDLNPMPTDVRPRIHALAIDEAGGSSSLETALAAAPAFGLGSADSRAIALEVASAVATWRTVAKRQGIKPSEIDRMSSAFEHDDFELARSLRGRS